MIDPILIILIQTIASPVDFERALPPLVSSWRIPSGWQ